MGGWGEKGTLEVGEVQKGMDVAYEERGRGVTIGHRWG